MIENVSCEDIGVIHCKAAGAIVNKSVILLVQCPPAFHVERPRTLTISSRVKFTANSPDSSGALSSPDSSGVLSSPDSDDVLSSPDSDDVLSPPDSDGGRSSPDSSGVPSSPDSSNAPSSLYSGHVLSPPALSVLLLGTVNVCVLLLVVVLVIIIRRVRKRRPSFMNCSQRF